MNDYETLSSIMLQIHGFLKEVKFSDKPKIFSLVFGDGTELEPYSMSQRRKWYEKYANTLANAGFTGDPLDGMTFGYDGTGSRNLSSFLKGCGFKNFSAVMSGDNFAALPVVLKPDGTLSQDIV